MAFGIKDVINGAKAVAGDSLVQGVLGNYNEMDKATMEKDFGLYMMEGEEFVIGFKLIRDALVFTDKRIIFADKQGATGSKMRIESINLFSVVGVTMETAGFGFDDTELTFTYIKTPNVKSHYAEYASHTIEFPKNYDVQTLYRLLQSLAYENCAKINGF